MHDPLSVGDLVDDELRQRRESGYDLSALETRVMDTSPRDLTGSKRCTST